MPWDVDYSAELSRREYNADLYYFNRQKQTAMLKYYSTRPTEWIEDYCFTYDPRRIEGIKTVPFILFPRQRLFVQFLQECLRDKESGLVEKCRDGGLTWLCCCFAVWAWLFIPGASIGFGSNKEMKVDRVGDPDSIFEKCRIIISYLPYWMLPGDFMRSKHLNYLKIINPASDATIKGEAGDSIGRGGRSMIFFKDESAHYERAERIEAALSANTDIQIDVSSVNGTNNVFYKRRMGGEIWESGKEMPKGVTRIFIFDWRDDPRKTPEWYGLKRKKFEIEGMLHIFAQEYDRDYFSSMERILIRQEWFKACIDAHKVLNIKIKGEKVGAQDVADGGGDRNALTGRHGILLNYAEHWGGEAQEAAKKAIPIAMHHGWGELYYDCIGVGVGFKVQVKNMQGSMPPRLKVLPWDASGAVQDPEKNVIAGDPQSPKNEDHFLNWKAQAWWRFRTRVYKTFRAVRYGENYDSDELVSISSDLALLHQIEMEMCQPTYDYNQAGKMLVDKKPDGAISPNMADSIIMNYNPVREARGFFSA